MTTRTMTGAMVSPYLTFGGKCEEALAFYTRAIGAQVEMVMRFNESPDPVPEGMLQKGFEKKIMHCSFKVGESVVMASDGCHEGSTFSGFSLSLGFATVEEAQKAFTALSEGGKVTMPLGKTFWSPGFGMLVDKFGVAWMVNVVQTH